MVLNLIFLGPPGAGKGTVAQAVAEKNSLVQLSTGDLVRGEIASGSEFGLRLKELYDKGQFAPDDFIMQVLEKKLSAIYSSGEYGGVIFDGVPRNINQAKLLDEVFERIEQKLTAVIYIESSEDNIVSRLSSRWTCPKCKVIYNTVTNLPKEEGKCDTDGELLFQRDDDKPEIIRERLQVYNEQTAPLIEYYKEKDLLKSYDGNVPPAESIVAAEKLIEELK